MASVAGGTAREGAPDGSVAGGSGFVRVGLLPCLTGRFNVVSDLGGGGEADVLLVADGAGQRWVAKQYRQPGWSPSVDVLDRLADARAGRSVDSWGQDPASRGVVWLQEWGTDPSSGLFFEVQEYISGGSLLDKLRAWPVTELAAALSQTVTGFHDLVGAHRDIKPANVLVRSEQGPVLVLVDVGLSRDVGELSHRLSKRDGSAAYQAPEAAQGLVSRAGDWWSVGMMVAEAALGFHPLALPNGAMPGDQVMLAELAQRDVPHLDLIEDDRVRLLCQGLLTRDADKRWRAPQVRAWRAGESPTTGYGNTGSVVAPVGPTRSVWFGGADRDSPQALAAAFASDPELAGRVLFEQKNRVVLDDLRSMLRAHQLHEALSLLEVHRSGPWQGTMLRLLAEMDPDLEPQLSHQSVTPSALEPVLRQALDSGVVSDDLATILRWITDHEVWQIWRRLPGMGEAAAMAERLPSADQLAATIGAAAPSDLDQSSTRQVWEKLEPLLRGWCVLLAIEPTFGQEELSELLESQGAELADQGWWHRLATAGDSLNRVAACLTIPMAAAAQNEIDAEVTRRAEAAAQQRRLDQRKAEVMAQREPRRRALERELARHHRLGVYPWNREIVASLEAELAVPYPWDDPTLAWNPHLADWVTKT